jgi:hypothetical protein
MMEGYDHDDIYLMVEDEFHSIAQTFTQHLHHAEYQRLKKKARDAAAPTFQPTEHMRVETRKKLEARALHMKQKDTVGNFTNGLNLSEGDEEQEDDPWLGTSLAGLMTDANSQKRTALVGLEKIQSDTRAARGFGRGTGDSPAGRREKMSVFDIFAKPGNAGESVFEEQEHESRENESRHSPEAKTTISKPKYHENPGRRKPGISHKSALKATGGLTATTEPSSSIRDATNSRSHTHSREPSVAARRLFDDFDKFEDLERTTHAPSAARRVGSPRSRRGSKSIQTKDRRMQMHDIPTFLV